MPRKKSVQAAIIVMGVSGSGKSTLGRLLAARLECPFVEGDLLHDAASIARMRAGQPLDDKVRRPWLDRIGAALNESIAAGGAAVAACSALKFAYRERLRQAIRTPVSFILLEAPPVELARRLNARTDHFMPASLLESQLATLEPPGPAEHALVLDATLPPGQLCEAALRWLTGAAQGRAE